jgi:hypothetical protein
VTGRAPSRDPADAQVDIVLNDDAGEATGEDTPVVVLDEAAAADPLPERAVRNEDGSITLPLLYPVTLKFKKASSGDVREETLEELVMRRLTGADMRAITAASNGHMVAVGIARSARIGEAKMMALFDRMDGADANAAAQVVGFFLGSGRPTGR